jgi:hypothetical protein
MVIAKEQPNRRNDEKTVNHKTGNIFGIGIIGCKRVR